MGGEVDVSTGLAGVDAPNLKRGVSSGGEGPPLEPGLLGNCWCCLCVARRGDNSRSNRKERMTVAWRLTNSWAELRHVSPKLWRLTTLLLVPTTKGRSNTAMLLTPHFF